MRAPRVAEERQRLRLVITGAVQGVGFRPFIYRLAQELALTGWVMNSPQGVTLEVEGATHRLEQFRHRLKVGKPPRSFIQSLEASWLDAIGHSEFQIRESAAGGEKTALVLPDIATCEDCLREIFDPANRRYRYPFTNCTNCGPRFSIIESLPYDRLNTSMKSFQMCAECQREYDNPEDRRFHAQPNACPACGPHLELWDAKGQLVPGQNCKLIGNDALLAAAAAIRSGKLVAVQGLGGFHLMVLASNARAVARLRELKHREEKPFAVMFPDSNAVRGFCELSEAEARLLSSPEAPIVLLRKIHSPSADPHAGVAPGNPYLGAMLPYTPLHALLLAVIAHPVVATSGNRSDEPICTDAREALERLAGIADLFLVHNRPIVRHVDDSIVRLFAGREMVLRRARGFAPLPIPLGRSASKEMELPTILAVGANLKNTVALAVGSQAFISQHLGDLETPQAFDAFRRVITDFEKLYEAKPGVVAADLHPDYLSTKFARSLTAPSFVSVQHHEAHILSCMAENEVPRPCLGVAWDGTGYGTDGTIWGGEFFVMKEGGSSDSFAGECMRFAQLRPFRLPGGDQAVIEPRRAALSLLFETYGAEAFQFTSLQVMKSFSERERTNLRRMLERGLNSPLTSSAGRLFDGVAALAGVRHKVRFEGQAAMELEFALPQEPGPSAYTLALVDSPAAASGKAAPLILDWSLLVRALVEDLRRGVAAAEISMRFHNALVEAIVSVARRAALERVVLSGGCFQNRFLTERTIARLREEGFRPYWHQRVPPNDGGIALGQVVAARGKACSG